MPHTIQLRYGRRRIVGELKRKTCRSCPRFCNPAFERHGERAGTRKNKNVRRTRMYVSSIGSVGVRYVRHARLFRTVAREQFYEKRRFIASDTGEVFLFAVCEHRADTTPPAPPRVSKQLNSLTETKYATVFSKFLAECSFAQLAPRDNVDGSISMRPTM